MVWAGVVNAVGVSEGSQPCQAERAEGTERLHDGSEAGAREQGTV